MKLVAAAVPAAIQEVSDLVDEADKALSAAHRAMTRLQHNGVQAADKVGIPVSFIADVLESASNATRCVVDAADDLREVHTRLHEAKAELSKLSTDEGPQQRAGGPWGKE